jgi:hypothetical protein
MTWISRRLYSSEILAMAGSMFSTQGQFMGQLQSHNRTIVIDGLWALSFAPTTSTIDQKRLYFTAGPAAETDGLFGYLIKN